ncbi:MAG: hypothetical protein ACFFFB_01570 [Candidatus Heimdallarchaeota archaeon]
MGKFISLHDFIFLTIKMIFSQHNTTISWGGYKRAFIPVVVL